MKLWITIQRTIIMMDLYIILEVIEVCASFLSFMHAQQNLSRRQMLVGKNLKTLKTMTSIELNSINRIE